MGTSSLTTSIPDLATDMWFGGRQLLLCGRLTGDDVAPAALSVTSHPLST